MSHIVKHLEIDVLVNFPVQPNHTFPGFGMVPVQPDHTFPPFGIVENIKNRRGQGAPGKSDRVRGGGQGHPGRSRIPSEPAVRDSRETEGVRGHS